MRKLLFTLLFLSGTQGFTADCPVTIEKISSAPAIGQGYHRAFSVQLKNTTPDKTVKDTKMAMVFFDATHDPYEVPDVMMADQKVEPGKDKKVRWELNEWYSRRFHQGPKWAAILVTVDKVSFTDGSVWAASDQHECSLEWAKR